MSVNWKQNFGSLGMTQIELGKIMAEAQKVADVKDARVSKRTGVSEVVSVGPAHIGRN